MLCIAYKIFSNILFNPLNAELNPICHLLALLGGATIVVVSRLRVNRLMPYVETTTGDYQCGYHQERSTVDQIFTVRQILEKCSKHGKDTHHLFIDFKVIYDSIDRCRLYAAMEELNIPKKLIALFKTTMKNTKCRVKMQNRLS